MTRTRLLGLPILVVAVLSLGNLPRTQGAEPADLAAAGYQILKQYCYRCHGQRFDVEGFNVLNRTILLEKVPEEDAAVRYVTPAKLDQSLVWIRTGIRGDMPPGENARPNAEELATLRKWLEAGAEFPAAETRKPVSEKEVFRRIRFDLGGMAREDRPFARYFTLTHLYNNSFETRVGRQGKNYDAADLRVARAALAKLVNSLSWKQEIAVPRIVDAGQEEVVLAIDLRDLGWDERNLWNEILKLYPYGLTYNVVASDDEFRELATQVYDLSGSKIPAVRLDWFLDTASRPPLYHTMLDLPDTTQALEKLLRVNPEADFLRDRLARAGFAESGVSRHNRLVDRHAALYGAYWKSYDFSKSETTGNLFQFPLGPKFEANPFPRQAFEHAGGEMIFHLPNGLQGYLLTDAEGKRIDKGPVEIVRDLKETSGTPEVVNGLSCMACHEHGMIRFRDTVFDGLAVFGEASLKVKRLFKPAEEMEKLLLKDEQRFLAALEEAAGPFLQTGPDKGRDIRSFPDPIGAVARYYQKDLELDDVAAELGVTDPVELRAIIRSNLRLREFGLGPLLQGAAIKRSLWQNLERSLSPFQQTAFELQLGTPHRSF